MNAKTTSNRVYITPDLFIDDNTREDFIKQIKSYLGKKNGRLVFYLDAHKINIFFEDNEYKAVFSKADLVYNGGVGVYIAALLHGRRLKEHRISGTYTLPLLVSKLGESGIFLLGASDDVISKAADKLSEKYSANITGFHNGFFKEDDLPVLINKINKSKSSILLVGMGSPLQEKWAYQNKDKLDLDAIICVGGLFDYLAGVNPYPPSWVGRLWLEWVHRLITHPGRLWKRYTIGNIKFLLRMILTR